MRAEEIPTIFIGRKGLMNYIVTAMSMIMNKDTKKIRICARGAGISRAVDVAEILRTRYLKNLVEIESVKIGTSTVKNPEGRIDRISTIEIILAKKG
ncbi:MAG: DNA/RNA-binding protein AlbA [Candidatus Njordarchaeales archaeon]